jgi:hypothetical protein
MYRTSPFALRLHGFGSSVPSGSKLDVLASPKFQSPQAAEGVDWHSDFLTCFSDGLGLGFWGGEPTKLERKLKKAEDFSPFQRVGEMVMESTAQRMEDVHPYLHAKWQECGFEWLLQDVDLVVRPWGWEGEDAVFLSTKMSHDQMAQAIRRELGNELQISEYDGDDEYRRWQMWHPNRTNEVDHWL